ncbi:hypothetical protein HanIR_Chr11g0511911 [Helianthus annuus]|nr:hypothetical protein HanIR_Chr11g0511911 [Helianthus annuus]
MNIKMRPIICPCSCSVKVKMNEHEQRPVHLQAYCQYNDITPLNKKNRIAQEPCTILLPHNPAMI